MLLSLHEQHKIRHFGNSFMGSEMHWTISEKALSNYVGTVMENKCHSSGSFLEQLDASCAVVLLIIGGGRLVSFLFVNVREWSVYHTWAVN
jgi:hypothetical protein